LCLVYVWDCVVVFKYLVSLCLFPITPLRNTQKQDIFDGEEDEEEDDVDDIFLVVQVSFSYLSFAVEELKLAFCFDFQPGW
jgi:hypothetical protein